MTMLRDEVFNVFFGDLRITECLTKLRVLSIKMQELKLSDQKSNSQLQDTEENISNLIDQIDGHRIKKLRGCPPDRID